MKQTVLKAARATAIALVALELVYLLAANLALWTGLVARVLSGSPDAMVVTHGRAYTVIPGRVHVSDFSMRMQDRNIQFLLTIARAQVDIHLAALLRKTFHGDHVRCQGVSFRFVHRVHDTVGIEERLAAYPTIPGLARPALFQVPPPPAPTPEDVAAQWTVRLDDVRVDVRELWFLEYRWEGSGRASGGFALSPMRRLQVGPAELVLDGGDLRAGPHLVSRDLRLRIGVTVESFDVQALEGLQVFRPISATAQLEAMDFSPGLLALYVQGLTADGAGRLSADLRIQAGRLGRGSRVDLKMESTQARKAGFVYEGAPQLTVSDDTVETNEPGVPRVHAVVPGSVVIPLAPGTARVDLTGLTAHGALSGRDIAEGIALAELDARLVEGRVVDARAVRAAALGSTPLTFVSPVLLGDGPLVLSGAVDMRRTVTIALLRHARLGLAEMRGAARTSPDGWDGAVAGHLGFLPVGVRLKGSKTKVELFVPDLWLATELAAAGIRLEEIPPAH
jgi:hypothetical protein